MWYTVCSYSKAYDSFLSLLEGKNRVAFYYLLTQNMRHPLFIIFIYCMAIFGGQLTNVRHIFL